jgi:type I protein arginine methyltransferase
MFPSHATMYWGCISHEEDRIGRKDDFEASIMEWLKFSTEMKDFYQLDVSALDTPYEKEQENYYIYSSLWTELHLEHLVGQPVVIKKLDLNKCTLADAECVHPTHYSITVPFTIAVSGFAGWFTVDFNGSDSHPATKRVTLTTGPEGGFTHWGQQVFYLSEKIDCTSDTKISGSVAMPRQDKNKRLYNLNLTVQVDDRDAHSFKYEIP